MMIPLKRRPQPRPTTGGTRWRRRAALCLAGACLWPAALHADDTNQVSAEFMRQVLERLQRDEAEIKELKAQLAARPPAPAPATNAAGDPGIQQRLARQDAEIKDLRNQIDNPSTVSPTPAKYPVLDFHVFGDLQYTADNRNGKVIPYGDSVYGGHNTFLLGSLDLFANMQLGDKVAILSETALSAGLNNATQIDIERLVFQYHPSDYFNIDAGRFHTALGYYNTEYHHGTWLETAVGRPSFLEFEDSGGILPVHMVGVSLNGAVPSGALNLKYFVELGNGLNYSSNENQDAVQQAVSFGASKAVNLAFTAAPDWFSGLRFGGGVYYDRITPDLATVPLPGGPAFLPRNQQFIFNGHIVYHQGPWEFLNEAYLIRDKPQGGDAHYSPALFTQISRKWYPWTPYVRFTYYNLSRNDALYTYAWDGGANSGMHLGPSLGLRWDFATYAALKFQYDYLVDSGLNDASRGTVQVSFRY